ncbi:MAG: UPF0236 family transposase-like protein [Bacillota bacterium]
MWTIRCLVEVILFVANGIYALLGNCRDFRELEIGIYRLVQEAARKMLEIALKRMDERLLLERDRGRLEVVHTRTRKVLTAFGEIEPNLNSGLEMKRVRGECFSPRTLPGTNGGTRYWKP